MSRLPIRQNADADGDLPAPMRAVGALLHRKTAIAGPGSRQQHRAGASRLEEENAARRRVSRNEAAAVLRKAFGAQNAGKVRSDPPRAQACAQEGAARGADARPAQEETAGREEAGAASGVSAGRLTQRAPRTGAAGLSHSRFLCIYCRGNGAECTDECGHQLLLLGARRSDGGRHRARHAHLVMRAAE